MSSPILYGPAYSTYLRAPRLALEEKSVDYELVEVDFIAGGMPAEQLERHPFGKVPAFEHDGFKLFEACAISRYVDEAFDGPALQPSSPRDRARMTQIMSISDSYVYVPTVGSLVIQRLVQPMLGGETDENAITEALPAITKAMSVLDDLVGSNEFLAGDTLSLADCQLVPIFDYFTKTPESETILGPLGNLRRWWEGMQARDSVQKTAPQLG